MTTIKKTILNFGGVEAVTAQHPIVRHDKQLLRRLVSTTANILTGLNGQRASFGLPPFDGKDEDAWHRTKELPSTHLTDALARRLGFLATDLTLHSDVSKPLRISLQNEHWATYAYSKGCRLLYQVRESRAGTTMTEDTQPSYTTIAGVLARPTKGRVELAFNDQLDLPVEGRGNILGSPPLMEAVMDDLTLLRDNVV